MYTTYLFDLDGTLLDTAQDLADAVNHIVTKYGYPACSYQQVVDATGNGARELIHGCLPAGVAAEEFDRILEEYKVYYEAHSCIKTAPYEGILPLLKTLQDKGCKVGIVSNKPHGAVVELAAKFFPGIPAFGEQAGIPRKPAPDMVYKAMEAIGAEKCIYVGDSDVDVKTAQNAGVPCLSVLWGFRGKEFLTEQGATHFCEDPKDLLTCLKEMIENG